MILATLQIIKHFIKNLIKLNSNKTVKFFQIKTAYLLIPKMKNQYHPRVKIKN